MLIRMATPEDTSDIHRLIYELAVYEKAPDEMVATIEQIEQSLFNSHPVAFCHVAEVDGKIVGIALWFLNYSTWLISRAWNRQRIYENLGSTLCRTRLRTFPVVGFGLEYAIN